MPHYPHFLHLCWAESRTKAKPPLRHHQGPASQWALQDVAFLETLSGPSTRAWAVRDSLWAARLPCRPPPAHSPGPCVLAAPTLSVCSLGMHRQLAASDFRHVPLGPTSHHALPPAQSWPLSFCFDCFKNFCPLRHKGSVSGSKRGLDNKRNSHFVVGFTGWQKCK